MQSLPIEKVIAKMRDQVVSLIDLLTDEMRFAGVPVHALQPLERYKVDITHRAPAWFNVGSNYTEATDQVIKCQQEVFKALNDPLTWLADHLGNQRETAFESLMREIPERAAQQASK